MQRSIVLVCTSRDLQHARTMALVLNTNAAISHLPDNILLEIFYCLTVKDLCYAGRCVLVLDKVAFACNLFFLLFLA